MIRLGNNRAALSERGQFHATTVAIRCLLAGVLISAAALPAGAIVTRHGVPSSNYLVADNSFPGLVDLPMEGHGVLISRQWVVTAAHATLMMRTMQDHDYVIINGKRRQVARIVLYPDYPTSAERWDQLFKRMKSEDAATWMSEYASVRDGMHDIALIELAEPIDDVMPVALYRGSAERGQVAELYGKGATGTDAGGVPEDAPHRGVLRVARNRIVGADAQWLSYTFDCSKAGVPLEGVIAGGDSGGPVLIQDDGQWKLAGVAHGLDGQINDLLSTRSATFRLGVCGQRFISSRISFYAPWIDGVLSADNRPSRTNLRPLSRSPSRKADGR